MHLSKDASKKQTNSQVVDEVVQRLTAVSPSLSLTLYRYLESVGVKERALG